MLLAALSLAACVRAQAPLTYVTIATAPPDDPIEFVHVEREQGELSLGVYARRRELVTWIAGQGPSADPPLVLASGEWFFRSQDGRRLGIRAFRNRSAAPGDPPDADRETRLRFPKGADAPSLPPVLGPRVARISDDASTLLLTPLRGESERPSTVTILRRSGPPPGAFSEAGSYTVARPGAVQMSRSGDVIAHLDGTEIRLLDGAGVERARIPAGAGFDLGPSGAVLAVRDATEVRILRLDEARPVPGGLQLVPLADRALGVELAGPFALVRGRTELVLVRWPTQHEVWRQTAEAGTYTSADLRAAGGEPRVVAGRLVVQTPAHRATGTMVWGRAEACVDVLRGDGELAFETHRFPTARWTYQEPRVRLVGRGSRVLVRTGDTALLSEVMP
jgi:hypothetical protein